MKELYTSPELKVTCFAPVERLAADASIEYSWLEDVSGKGDPVQASGSEFTVKLPKV